MARLSGIALSSEFQDRYRRHLKNCDPVSVVRVRTSSLFGEPSSSHLPRVGSACTVLLHPSLAATLSAPSAGTPLPLTIAGTSTAAWLSSLGDSPRPPPAPAIYSTVVNLASGYAVSWYSTTSMAHIGKKIILRPIFPRSPWAPDVPSAYNVNSCSGCVGPGSFRPEVKGPPPMRPDTTGSLWMHWTRPFCVQTP